MTSLGPAVIDELRRILDDRTLRTKRGEVSVTGLRAHIDRLVEQQHELIADATILAADGPEPDSAVARLDRIDGSDPDAAHGTADDVLLTEVPPDVAAAYQRVIDRCSWWAGA
ncbi:hypothetical protein [Nocardioides bruguierae]|uniref:Uncharacterized protein n=1 Tax=Nocardioides bruguierae TaxID=2945102 RepID=A0A9X2IGL6_9ACTN|nr:hypothetical protein [Nocardioides bruguierae]MCM0622492.1 hypothetical protein [Nocardioides bruguierae]